VTSPGVGLPLPRALSLQSAAQIRATPTCRAPEREGKMAEHPLTPQLADAALAEAVQIARGQAAVTLCRRRADTGGRVRPLVRGRRSRSLLTRLVPPLGFARSHEVRPAVFAKVLDAQTLFRCLYDTSSD
jgi:hypothetical protein